MFCLRRRKSRKFEKVVKELFQAQPALEPFKLTEEVNTLISSYASWSFDVLRLEKLTQGRILAALGITIFQEFHAPRELRVDDRTIYNWLLLIEANYRRDNPYHNATHAADVLQAAAYFLLRARKNLNNSMSNFDEVLVLIAAVAHDVNHLGKTNGHLVASRHPIAVLYNDASVLESLHTAFMFKITEEHPEANIFKNLSLDEYRRSRKNIVDMILGTDISKHFEFLERFTSFFKQEVPSLSDIRQKVVIGEMDLKSEENQMLIRKILIKCADICNPARVISTSVEWSRRISEEYFRQAEEEKSLKQPLSMAMYERGNCNVPSLQQFFIKTFVLDMFRAWDRFLGLPEVVDNILQSMTYWRALEEKGVKDAIYIPFLGDPVEIESSKSISDSHSSY